MRSLVWSILVINALGAVQAVRRDRRARWLGIDLPGTAAQHALTVGSGMSAPPLMLGALVVGAQRDRADVVGAIAVMMVAGILGEPNTWETLRRPRTDPLSAMCVLLQIALPLRLARDALDRTAHGNAS